jgi:aerobic-type carbon monoxide dehydrogenase small subunit (CoxS/CutS family)
LKKDIHFSLNGVEVRVSVRGHERLIDILREQLGLTGTKEGCGQGECGACTVIVDGRAVNSCLYPAPEIEGKSILTIEGLQGPDHRLSRLQQAFVDCGAIQCGYCTPGMILSAQALLETNPDPSEEEIRESLAGNLCRCTGYKQIVEAVKAASHKIQEKA